MENYLKDKLGCTFVKRSGKGGGGCISQGEMYHTDQGKIFVKENAREDAETMFRGEFASLAEINKTGTVKAPKPIKVLARPSGPGSLIVMEYWDMRRCSNQALLGEQLARMHLHNKEQAESKVEMYGFNTVTCCGFIPQSNKWSDDWVHFFTEKIEEQIRMQPGDEEIQRLWMKLRSGISQFFEGVTLFPSLLHGDLWSGNMAQSGSEPILFDPASFFGHHEYDLAIGKMFGGFGSEFHKSYHNIIPKEPGFERRSELYQLFHCLNHWNLFDDSHYRSQSLGTIKNLLNVSSDSDFNP